MSAPTRIALGKEKHVLAAGNEGPSKKLWFDAKDLSSPYSDPGAPKAGRRISGALRARALAGPEGGSNCQRGSKPACRQLRASDPQQALTWTCTAPDGHIITGGKLPQIAARAAEALLGRFDLRPYDQLQG
jgi:hypothetical protein